MDLSVVTEDDVVEAFKSGLRAFVAAEGGSFGSRRVTLRQEGPTDSTDANGEHSVGTLPERIAALERSAIRQAMADEGGNQSRAAARLGISERALRYKLAKYRPS